MIHEICFYTGALIWSGIGIAATFLFLHLLYFAIMALVVMVFIVQAVIRSDSYRDKIKIRDYPECWWDVFTDIMCGGQMEASGYGWWYEQKGYKVTFGYNNNKRVTVGNFRPASETGIE